MEINYEKLEQQGFLTKFSEIAGDKCVLITPSSDTLWDHSNLIFRSSIWTVNGGHPVSLSFPKFFNWDERNDIHSAPESLEFATVVEKIDGSALIVSKYKGELIVRTRGSFNTDSLDNKEEVELFKKIYPKAFDNLLLNGDKECSILFEWVSPTHQIILEYDEPELILTGVIDHYHYELLTQDLLDKVAEKWGFKRPGHFLFDDINSCVSRVRSWKGSEGVCVYYCRDQMIKKLKSLDYIKKHAFKYQMSMSKLLDLYIEWGCPSFEETMTQIESMFDYECGKIALPMVSEIIDAQNKYNMVISELEEFLEPLRGKSRKEIAEEIKDTYGGDRGKMGLCFTLLDCKEVSEKARKKLLYQSVSSDKC